MQSRNGKKKEKIKSHTTNGKHKIFGRSKPKNVSVIPTNINEINFPSKRW